MKLSNLASSVRIDVVSHRMGRRALVADALVVEATASVESWQTGTCATVHTTCSTRSACNMPRRLLHDLHPDLNIDVRTVALVATVATVVALVTIAAVVVVAVVATVVVAVVATVVVAVVATVVVVAVVATVVVAVVAAVVVVAVVATVVVAVVAAVVVVAVVATVVVVAVVAAVIVVVAAVVVVTSLTTNQSHCVEHVVMAAVALAVRANERTSHIALLAIKPALAARCDVDDPGRDHNHRRTRTREGSIKTVEHCCVERV